MGILTQTLTRNTTGFDIDGDRDIHSKTETSSRSAKTAGDFKIKIATSLEDMVALHMDWVELEKRSAIATQVFQSFDWCASWVEHIATNSDAYKIHILTVHLQDRLIMVWPMMTTCVGPICILRWLSDPFAQYGDVLIDKDIDHQQVFELAWQELTATEEVDAIRLRHVRKDSLIHDFLHTKAHMVGEPDTAPYMDLTQYKNEQDYEARYSKSQRRRRKRIRAGLEKAGPLEFSMMDDPQGKQREIKHAIIEKRKWLNERGLQSSPVRSGSIIDFLGNLGNKASGLETTVSVMSINKKTVSVEIGLRYKNRHFGYVTSHNNDMTNASPARLHMDLSQRKALLDGMDVFDLMVPGDRHKLSWSSGSVTTCDFCMPLTGLGSLYARVYLAMVRPMIKKAYHAMSPKWRSRIIHLICDTSSD